MASQTNLSWSTEEISLLAESMLTINRYVSERVESFEKDIRLFESEDAFGTPGGGEPSQHLDIVMEFFKNIREGIAIVAENSEIISNNINKICEIGNIGIKNNFKNQEEAKDALIANKNKHKMN